MTMEFSANGIPELIFGRGVLEKLPTRAIAFGTRALLVGDAYLQNHPSLLKEVSDKLLVAGLQVDHVSAEGKQTQEAAQKIASQFDLSQYNCVISLGAGRAIDTGKLVAHHCPHIAVPTTAGTGAPMNGIIFGGKEAVEETYRASLLPDLVIGDPAFIDEMDRDDFAARALSVLMLLSEAYIAPKASVLSDALVWSGLEAFTRGFVRGVDGEQAGRDEVFFAALMAGVGAGQAGFGLTHRFGALIEQKTELSYAQACASVCGEITDLQIQFLSDMLPDHGAMDKYVLIGELLAERPFEDREEAYASLVGTLRRWVARLDLAKITLSEDDVKALCRGITNGWDDQVLPARPGEDEMTAALLRRCL